MKNVTKIQYMRTVRYFGSIFSEWEAQMIGLIGKTNNKGQILVRNLTKIDPNDPQWARGIDYMLRALVLMLTTHPVLNHELQFQSTANENISAISKFCTYEKFFNRMEYIDKKFI